MFFHAVVLFSVSYWLLVLSSAMLLLPTIIVYLSASLWEVGNFELF